MGQSHGFSRAMYADETTFGTAVTRDTVLSRLQNISVSENNNMIYDRGLGEGLNIVKSYYGPYDVDFSGNLNVNDFDFFQYFIGPKSGSGTSGTPYVLTEATVGLIGETNSIDSFSMEVINTTETTADGKLLSGCVGNGFSLSGSIQNPLTASFEGFAQKAVGITSATSYTASTTDSYMITGGIFKWGATPTTLPGVRSFTLNYTNGMDKNMFRNTSSRLIEKPVLPSGRGYTGTLTVRLTQSLASTIYTSFYGQTHTSGPIDDGTSISTADLEFEIDLANGVRGATIWLDQCSINDITNDHDIGGGLRELTFNFTAQAGKGNTPIKWWNS